MQRAAALLRDGHQPIARVAEQVGYETEAAFSRAFKRITGLPPAHWRKTIAGWTSETKEGEGPTAAGTGQIVASHYGRYRRGPCW
jgi:AraC-like DNA-binding protein